MERCDRLPLAIGWSLILPLLIYRGINLTGGQVVAGWNPAVSTKIAIQTTQEEKGRRPEGRQQWRAVNGQL